MAMHTVPLKLQTASMGGDLFEFIAIWDLEAQYLDCGTQSERSSNPESATLTCSTKAVSFSCGRTILYSGDEGGRKQFGMASNRKGQTLNGRCKAGQAERTSIGWYLRLHNADARMKKWCTV